MTTIFEERAHIDAISPFVEMGAYEALWAEAPKASYKYLHEILRVKRDTYPSELIDHEIAIKYANEVLERTKNLKHFGIRIKGTFDYFEGLYDADHPLELLYYQGNWDYIYAPQKVAIVGTRNPSEEGKLRTRKLVDYLVAKYDCTIVSGLAGGIDTFAHKCAIQNKAVTIGVIGTPLTEAYPRTNRILQDYIAKNFLVISQVPFERYYRQNYKVNRFFFPERNITMSAITDATIIVEAGETSGSLTQARAALKQGRKLLIMNSCFERGLKWPDRFLSQGAIRIRDFEDIDMAMKDVWRL